MRSFGQPIRPLRAASSGGAPAPGPPSNAELRQDGSYLLREDGGKIVRES